MFIQLLSYLTMTRSLYVAMLASASFVVTSCGGSSESSSSVSESHSGGWAPDKQTAPIVLSPTDFDAGGQILLTNTPARVAYFNSERDGSGNYVDGTGGTFQQGQYTYTGNFTYTKCGPNMVELKVVNLRAEPADTAGDCHWTIIGHLTFVDEENVIFTGTETLDGGGAGGDDNEHSHNDPLGFGGINHFPGVVHTGGGTRNFSLNYKFKMGD